jgi:hypothetical protein
MNLGRAIGLGTLGFLAVSGLALWNNIRNHHVISKEEVLVTLETARI